MGVYEDSLTAFRSGDSDLAELLALQLLGDSRDDDADGGRPGSVDALCMLARVALRRGGRYQGSTRGGEVYKVSTRADEAWEVSLGAVGRREEVRLKRMPIHLMAVAARMLGEYAD